MNTTLESIESAARLLSVKDRAALAHNLLKELDDVEGDERHGEALWISEAEDRLDGYLNGELKASPLSEVADRVRARIRR